jgi:hypothetical protein
LLQVVNEEVPSAWVNIHALSSQATHKDVLAVIVFSSVGHRPKFHPRDFLLFEKQAGPTSMVFLGNAAL